jgi:D-glycero-D-manno-heptose 1,7-bisphosphate phosphatase
MPRRVVFLDRDGTLNVDHGYVHEADKWEWVPGALDALVALQKAGYALAIVTNQSGIAHGLYTEEQMHELHVFMNKELQDSGIHIDAIAYCPHGRDERVCDCRKPDIGMAKQIEATLGPIEYGNSWTVGDKEADMLFGKTAGTKTALIRSKYWNEDGLSQKPDIVAGSLAEAARFILSQS